VAIKVETLEEKLKRLESLEKIVALKEGLPHWYGYGWYPWAWDFLNSAPKHKDAFICAANQIGKSTSQIRRIIHWATETKLWPELWPNRRPYVFWVLYPTKDICNTEWHTKWTTQFMPQGAHKDHAQYGWEASYSGKNNIHSVHFKTGVTLYFHSYNQGLTNLQATTVDYIAFDEELPEKLYNELSMRRIANNGYMSGVFTATLSQEMWRRCFEEIGTARETFKDAFKRQVSMYDCMKYTNGKKSHWTKQRIQQVIQQCKDENEVQRRVFGKFISSTNDLKCPTFDEKRHVKPVTQMWEDPKVYCGVDPGSGGASGHPSAIMFVAVNPEYTKARVYKGVRMDGQLTTSGDVLEKFRQMKGDTVTTGQFYDYADRDFFTIACRIGEPFYPAEKNHEIGENIINTLFKHDALIIDDIPELEPLVHEIKTVRKGDRKTKAHDDAYDALRYALSRIPFNWPIITSMNEKKIITNVNEIDESHRIRGHYANKWEDLTNSWQSDIDEWNELLES
jgi:phage terminase large subunit-like protein